MFFQDNKEYNNLIIINLTYNIFSKLVNLSIWWIMVDFLVTNIFTLIFLVFFSFISFYIYITLHSKSLFFLMDFCYIVSITTHGSYQYILYIYIYMNVWWHHLLLYLILMDLLFRENIYSATMENCLERYLCILMFFI